MTAAPLPEDRDWPTWTRIDLELLERAQGEEPFFEAATALATEFGQLTALLARSSRDAGGRDQAVLRGLAVRIVKLTRRLIAETLEGRGEMQTLLDQWLFETTLDLAYLLRGGEERYETFLREGTRADRRVWQHLERNRELRGGEALPQEQRMRARLEQSARLAGLEPGSMVGEGDAPPWPALPERLSAVGEPNADAMHQLGSDVVHGMWDEVVTHHLTGGDAFEPKLEWSRPRVQPLSALAIQGSRVMAAYARHLGRDVATAFRDKYLELSQRAASVDAMHEEYLARAGVGPPGDYGDLEAGP